MINRPWERSDVNELIRMQSCLLLLPLTIYVSICVEDRSHDRTSVSGNTLKKPNITSWELDSHYLVVNWKHSDIHQQVHGYYLLLCRLVNSQCTGPDFVNFGKMARSGRIVGLAPEAVYQVEVIAYTGGEHVSSDRVTVNTQRLKFLKARNFTVSHITCCSAVFHWKHEPENNVHDVKFLLRCKGKRKYVNVHKKLIDEDHTFEHSSPSTSKDVETIYAGELESNTKYLCSMSSMSGTIKSPTSEQVSFTTLPGTPSTPPTPVLSLGHDHTFTAGLYPTDERFGSISHYLLIAVPVSKSASDPLTAPYQPIVPLKNLLFKALSSKKMVTKIPQPLPFIVAAFEPKTLPVNYNFGYEWRSVFKQKTHYSVVLTAFTKGEDSKVFHSLSALSSPVYITEDLVETWLRQQRPIAKKFTVIVVSSIFAVVILFTIAFLVLFISNYCYAKRRDAKEDYMFAISNTDSDEEEIFSKGESKRNMANQGCELIQTHKAQVAPLSKKSPNMTHADWAVENLSHSPAFREMIEKHPEALDEMKDVMDNIGHKWEVNQYNAIKTNTPTINPEVAEQAYLSSDSSFSEPIYSSNQPLAPPIPPHQQRTRYAHRRPGRSYDARAEEMSDVDLTEQHYRY